MASPGIPSERRERRVKKGTEAKSVAVHFAVNERPATLGDPLSEDHGERIPIHEIYNFKEGLLQSLALCREYITAGDDGQESNRIAFAVDILILKISINGMRDIQLLIFQFGHGFAAGLRELVQHFLVFCEVLNVSSQDFHVFILLHEIKYLVLQFTGGKLIIHNSPYSVKINLCHIKDPLVYLQCAEGVL